MDAIENPRNQPSKDNMIEVCDKYCEIFASEFARKVLSSCTGTFEQNAALQKLCLSRFLDRFSYFYNRAFSDLQYMRTGDGCRLQAPTETEPDVVLASKQFKWYQFLRNIFSRKTRYRIEEGARNNQDIYAIKKDSDVYFYRLNGDGRDASWEKCRLLLVHAPGGFMLQFYDTPEGKTLFDTIFCFMLEDVSLSLSKDTSGASTCFEIKPLGKDAYLLATDTFEDSQHWVTLINRCVEVESNCTEQSSETTPTSMFDVDVLEDFLSLPPWEPPQPRPLSLLETRTPTVFPGDPIFEQQLGRLGKELRGSPVPFSSTTPSNSSPKLQSYPEIPTAECQLLTNPLPSFKQGGPGTNHWLDFSMTSSQQLPDSDRQSSLSVPMPAPDYQTTNSMRAVNRSPSPSRKQASAPAFGQSELAALDAPPQRPRSKPVYRSTSVALPSDPVTFGLPLTKSVSVPWTDSKHLDPIGQVSGSSDETSVQLQLSLSSFDPLMDQRHVSITEEDAFQQWKALQASCKTNPNQDPPDVVPLDVSSRDAYNSGEASPDLTSYPWYHGSITRAQASMLVLQGGSQAMGMFVVRKSESSSGEFAITFNFGGCAYHVRFTIPPSGQCIIEGRVFRSVSAMLDHYKLNFMPVRTSVSCVGIKLTDFIPVSASPPLA